MKLACLVHAVALFVSIPRAVFAESSKTCPISDRPVVELIVEVEPPDQVIADNLEKHLRGELAAREIDLCTTPSKPRKPIAYVRLRVTRSGSSVSALIEVRDQITDKRVERTIELGALPIETRPLVVAAATDELLRVSWTELTIGDAPPPAMAPPAAVVRAVETQPRVSLSKWKEPSERFTIAAQGRASVFSHRTALGVSALFGVALPAHLLLSLHLGAERGLARSGSEGTTRADAWLGGLALAWSPHRTRVPLGARFVAGVDLARVHFVGEAQGDARATDAYTSTAIASLGAQAVLRVGAFEASLGVSMLAALRPVRARDAAGASVTSIEGLGAGCALGLGGWF